MAAKPVSVQELSKRIDALTRRVEELERKLKDSR
jgi:polyhydroxyalkanoate synthesis regulator phasin